MKTTDELLLGLMETLNARDTISPDNIKKRLLILSTPRSGSSMFCDVLSQTGLIGECREWFNSRYLQAYLKMSGVEQLNFSDYVDFILGKTIADTGIFAVNVHIDQYIALLNSKVDLFTFNFDHIIYLRRKDVIAQTVSLAKASLSDAWSSGSAGREISTPLTNASLLPFYNQLTDYERYYQQHLAVKVQAEYQYEDFAKTNKSKAYQQVLTALNLPAFEGEFKTNMQKQSGGDSAKVIAGLRKYIFG